MPEELIIKKVRDGLFLASSRSYGEQYVEPLIRAKYSLDEPKTNDHDGTDTEGKRYEIKACKILRATHNHKGIKAILERILFENDNDPINRLVSFEDSENAEYLANVQNVKRDHFDYLIYVLLFADCIKVFKAGRGDIMLGSFTNWSDKHGRYDALGKSGQFAITKRNIGWHLDKYLLDTILYREAFEIYSALSKDYANKEHNSTE